MSVMVHPGWRARVWPPKRRPKRVAGQRAGEIAALMAEGLSNREIAARLCVSEKTVKNHLTVAYRRAGITGSASGKAAMLGLIERRRR